MLAVTAQSCAYAPYLQTIAEVFHQDVFDRWCNPKTSQKVTSCAWRPASVQACVLRSLEDRGSRRPNLAASESLHEHPWGVATERSRASSYATKEAADDVVVPPAGLVSPRLSFISTTFHRLLEDRAQSHRLFTETRHTCFTNGA